MFSSTFIRTIFGGSFSDSIKICFKSFITFKTISNHKFLQRKKAFFGELTEIQKYISHLLNALSFKIKFVLPLTGISILLCFCFVNNSFADTVTIDLYNPRDTVTSFTLNRNDIKFANTLNGSLTNQNMNTDDGFRAIEILEALPSPGIQGRVVFLTSNNTLNFDTGATYLATALLANAQTFTGSNTFAGNVTMNGTTNIIGNGGSDTLTLNTPSGITYTPAATWTFTNSQTVSGTWANLGIVTTTGTFGLGAKLTAGANEIEGSNFDINGGTMDGVQIDGATTTGTVWFNDASDDVSVLVPGADNTVLTSTGTAAAPAWEAMGFTLISTTPQTPDTNSGDIAIEPNKQYYVTFEMDNATDTASNVEILFNSTSSGGTYAWGGEGRTFNGTSAVLTDGDDSDTSIVLMDSGTEQYAKAMDTSSNNGFIRGSFYIDTNKIGTVFSAFVDGSFVAKDSDSALLNAQFGGVVTASLTITDFEMFTSQNVNMVIKTYELR